MKSVKFTNNIVTKNILLVDDECDLILALKYILKAYNFKVDTFTDPAIALKYFKINFYDLVILDIKMPKMDGFQLYTKLREKDDKVKICFLTASAIFTEQSEKSILKLVDKNIDKGFFIQKPIRTEDLIKRISWIINKNNEGIVCIN
jgi:DNA-binding response OmpR family regulator